MKNAGSCTPFISTTGGCKSNSGSGFVSGASATPVAAPPEATDDGEDEDEMPSLPTPAAAHAAGFVMPAFIIAAATFWRCAGFSTGAGLATATDAISVLAPKVKLVAGASPEGRPEIRKENFCASPATVLIGMALAVVP